jgi:hypothetical protein
MDIRDGSEDGYFNSGRRRWYGHVWSGGGPPAEEPPLVGFLPPDAPSSDKEAERADRRFAERRTRRAEALFFFWVLTACSGAVAHWAAAQADAAAGIGAGPLAHWAAAVLSAPFLAKLAEAPFRLVGSAVSRPARPGRRVLGVAACAAMSALAAYAIAEPFMEQAAAAVVAAAACLPLCAAVVRLSQSWYLMRARRI